MIRNRWRSLPFLAAIVLVATAIAIHLAVPHLAKEAPNYTRIEEGLFLGGHVPEPPPGTLAVLNLDETRDSYQALIYRWEPIPDAAPVPDIAWLQRQVEFVESQRKAGLPVFVHCRNGVSRSGMVVAAYLISRNAWTRDKTLEFIRSKRPIVRPHPVFMSLLLEWERIVLDEARSGARDLPRRKGPE